MKNFVSISYNQGGQVVAQVENALKNAGLSPADYISGLITFDFFYGAVKNHLEKEGFFVSETFSRTFNLFVNGNGAIQIKQSSIENFLKEVYQREKKHSRPLPHVSPDIWQAKDLEIVTRFGLAINVHQYFLRKTLPHWKVLEEIKKVAKKDFSYFEALQIVRAAILDGRVDTDKQSFVVYYVNKTVNSQSEYYFLVTRTEGKLSIESKTVYYQPQCETTFRAGGAVFFE